MDAGDRREIEQKVYGGQRLDRADGIALYGCGDLVWLGRLAQHRRSTPDRVTFTVLSRVGPEDAGAFDGDTVAVLRYGLGETREQRVDQLLRIRETQDETDGFVSFLGRREPSVVSPAEALATFAVARLLLDNVPRLTCDLASDGPSLAQLAMNFGVDDLAGVADDGTAGERDAEASRADLVTLIGDAGFRPVERDAHHQVVREYDAPPSLAERRSVPQRVWA
ncbi:hypothetical protein [Plantactinospora sp. GCM10030261]|uniref:hypothetical protein n=1 Tax=Plantactinospora sp. GCM10030261 TaxID=3273420 RepID=UPI00361A5588